MGNGTHSVVVWVGLGRMGFNADVDGCCVEVEVLADSVVDVVVFGSWGVVVLVENGGAVSVPRYNHRCVVVLTLWLYWLQGE